MKLKGTRAVTPLLQLSAGYIVPRTGVTACDEVPLYESDSYAHTGNTSHDKTILG